MKQWKRMLSAVLVCAMVFPLASTYVRADANSSNTTNSVAWFKEEFDGTTDDLKKNGWTNIDTTRHTLTSDQKLSMTARYNYLCTDEAQQWSNYTLEAEVSASKESLANSTAKTRTAGIVAAATLPSSKVNNTGAGYCFYLVYVPDTSDSTNWEKGTWRYELWDRTGSSAKTLAKTTEQWAFDTTYNMKMVIDGTNIKCYVNDVMKLDYTVEGATSDLTGTIATHTNGISATYDNIAVRANGLLFSEKYVGTADDLKKNGWTNIDTTRHTLTSDQKLLMTGRYNYLCTDEAQQWSNYTLEAEVTASKESLANSTAKTRTAGIVAAATLPTSKVNNTGAGYCFYLVYVPDTSDSTNWEKGTWRYELWDRTGSSAKTLAKTTEKWEFDTTYDMKMVIDGTNIKCYVNDVMKLDYTVEGATSDLMGTIATHTNGVSATYDNICVWENANITQDEDDKDDTEDKDDLEEGLWFKEVFEDEAQDLVTKGWNYIDNTSYFSLTGDEKLLVMGNYNYLCTEEAKKWNNYTLEAEVTASKESLSNSTAKTRVAGIVAAATLPTTNVAKTGAGYCFYLVYVPDTTDPTNWEKGTWSYQLWDRTGGSAQTLAKTTEKWEFDTTYNLKMVLDGTNIKCYVNDELKLNYTVEGATGDLTGTIATQTSGIYATYDNICVRETSITKDEDDLEDGLWFKEVFDGTKQDLISTGWDQGAAAIITSDEWLQLSTKSSLAMYLTEYKGADDWTNYTVEADVILTDTEIEGNTSKSRLAGLIAAANGKNKGYEFMISYYAPTGSFTYQLKDRITGADLTKAVKYPFELGQAVNLKMALSGNTIECYIDGELEATCEVPGVTDLKGTIGVRGVGNVTLFDNIRVYETQPSYKLPPLTDVTGLDVWFTDNFSSTDSLMTERGWSKEYQIHDGKVGMLGGGAGTAYINGIEKAYEWKDYTVETDVCVVDDSTVTSSVKYPTAYLCARSTSEKTGYEFGLQWNKAKGTSTVLLYDRTTATTLATYTDVTINKEQTYNLKMTVKGNQIDCYLDGELVISATDTKNSNPVGTAGIRKSGYLTYFDNVKVYKTGRYHSPQTGDMSYVYLYVLVLCASVTLYATKVYRRKNEHNV